MAKQMTPFAEKITGYLQSKYHPMVCGLMDMYEAMRPEEREILVAWVNRAAPIARCESVSNLIGSLRVGLSYPVGADDGISISDMPVALARWVLEGLERGDVVADPNLHDYGIG
jgi:hypothetical protein